MNERYLVPLCVRLSIELCVKFVFKRVKIISNSGNSSITFCTLLTPKHTLNQDLGTKQKTRECVLLWELINFPSKSAVNFTQPKKVVDKKSFLELYKM